MMSRHDLSRNKLFAAGATLLILAVALPWAISRLTARSADDPHELLRRATESNGTAESGLVSSKTVETEGTTSTGETIRADLTTIKSRTGKTVGFAPRLREPLKPGETATLKLPGGGHVVISSPPAGETSSPTVTPPRSRP